MNPPDQLRCLRCDSALEEGFFVDHGHYDMTKVSAWVGGKPEMSFWTGVKAPKGERKPVRAMRCVSCGRLELFA